MEKFESYLAPLLALLIVTNNIITIVEGFATGKIKSYSRTIHFRILGEKPTGEYSLNFETSFFWIEVGFNMLYVFFGAVVIYFTLFR